MEMRIQSQKESLPPMDPSISQWAPVGKGKYGTLLIQTPHNFAHKLLV